MGQELTRRCSDAGLKSDMRAVLQVQSIFFSDPGKRSTSSVGSPALHHAHSLTDK